MNTFIQRIFARFQNSYRITRARQWWRWKDFLFRHRLPLSLRKGEWSMNTADFEVIFHKIKMLPAKDRTVFVELGSGVSTIILGTFLSRLNPQNLLISFEGSSEWTQEVYRLIEKHGLQNSIHLYHVPYQKYPNHSWFDENKITEIIQGRYIDVLLTDAPPGDLCSCSRGPALRIFRPWLSEGSVVFLHDTQRPDEAQITTEWKTQFRFSKNITTPAGLAVLEGLIPARPKTPTPERPTENGAHQDLRQEQSSIKPQYWVAK